MKWVVFISFLFLQVVRAEESKSSILDIDQQMDDELRRQKLEERHPVPTPVPGVLDWESNNTMQTECYAEGKCATILKPKKVTRTDGLEVR